MAASHTPGPWSAHCNDLHPTDGDDGKRFWDVCAGNVHKSPAENYVSGYIACPDFRVASVQFGPSEANARLIAAAPELLEACHEAERFLDYFANGRHEFHGPGTPASALEQVCAAIARATGAEA